MWNVEQRDVEKKEAGKGSKKIEVEIKIRSAEMEKVEKSKNGLQKM